MVALNSLEVIELPFYRGCPLAMTLLQACSITPLVRNADILVKASRKCLGDTVTFGVMRQTFMKQFCAGETEDDLWPTMDMLRANGIGAIIDYAGVRCRVYSLLTAVFLSRSTHS